MTITYTQARTPKTQAELRAKLIAALAAKKAPVAGWSERAPQRIIVDDVALRTAEASEIYASLAAMVSLSDLATLDRDWVAAWMTWFDEEYIPALPAVWDLPLSTSSPPTSIGPGEFLVQANATGAPIFEVAAGTARTSLPGTVRVTCRTPGVVGNIAPASFAKILTAPSGVSPGIGLPALVTAGRAEETPAAAILRCLGKWSALGAGWTLDAFDYWIPLAAPTVTRWKVRDDSPFGPGTVLAILANASGPATPTEVALVQAKMGARNVRTLGSGAFLAQAAALDALALAITIRSDGSNSGLAGDVEAGLLALGAPFAIGPALLDPDLVRAVALGGAFRSFDVDDGSGGITTLPASIPGFAGAAGIVSCSLAAPHAVSSGAVLVLTPSVAVV